MFQTQFISQASLFIGIPVISVLFIYSKKNRNNIFLAISLLNIWYALLLNILNQSQAILDYPSMMRTGNISVLLFFPFLYLYTRGAFYPGIFFKKVDLLWLLPVFIYVVDMSTFFFADPNYKIALYQARLKDPSFALKISEGWIQFPGFQIILRYVSGLFFITFQIKIILRYWKTHLVYKRPENRIVYWHMLVLTIIYGTLVFPGIFGALLHLSWYNTVFIGLNLSLSLTVTAFFLLCSPGILYGFLPFSIVPAISSIPPIDEKNELGINFENESNNKVVDEKIIELVAKIENFVIENKVYLDSKYTIQSLSADVQLPVYQLSPLINNHFGETYNSWINQFRVMHFIELSKDPLMKDLTLEALAKDSGFSNRTTFINAFKKVTGSTPSTFLKIKD